MPIDHRQVPGEYRTSISMGLIKKISETIHCCQAPNCQVEHTNENSLTPADFQAIRNEALLAGAVDPATLRFRLLELNKFDGTLLSVPSENIGLSEALEQAAKLIRVRSDSHFCLEPVGFIQ
ncbi:MAG TPA: hypothetical protein VG273_16290 [Bryobacteraceae bacterium]|jgi:hypothetical protein|nr:hypothetical protein [Bryobacteraceae bacterium]